MKKTFIIILLLLFCFPANASAEKSMKAEWISKNNTIRLTWDRLPEDGEYYLYHNYGEGWLKDSSGVINNKNTARTLTNFPQNTECQYQIRIMKNGKSVGTYATSNKVKTKSNKFTAIVKWTGEDITISWTHADGTVEIWTDGAGNPAYVVQNDARKNATISLKSQGLNPQVGEHWKFRIFDDNNKYDRAVFCAAPSSGQDPGAGESEIGDSGTEDPGSEKRDHSGIPESIPIFQANSWTVVMFWYKVLASLSGVFVFFTFIRCGYQYMRTDNSGIRASAIDTLQKCVIALVFIMIAPTFIELLIQINDAIVELCLRALNGLTTAKNTLFDTDKLFGATISTDTDWIGSLFSWPFQIILDLIKKIFGLHNLGCVIFNAPPKATILSDNAIFAGGANTGLDIFSDVLLNIAFVAFTIYYNAVYLLRRWVVVAVTAVTPIIIWIWAMSENKQVIQIWLAEIFQTIFMQTFHALTFGIFFSVLCFNSLPSIESIGISDVATSLISIGKFVGWFAGITCVGAIIFNSFRLIVATNDKFREQAKSGLSRSIIGLIIIGLSLLIAGVLTGNQINIPIPNEASGTSDITIFQLFMVMVAIIPVSKMMSTIFMNLISRIGTVDEDKWAARSMGMIGGLFGLGMAAGKAASSVPGVPTPKNLAGEDSDIKPPDPISAENNLSYHSDPYGIKDALRNAPGTESYSGQYGSMLRPQDIGRGSGDWVYNHDTGRVQDYNDFVSGKNDYLEPPPMTYPQGIPVPASVDPDWSNTIYNQSEDKFYDAKTGEEVPGIIPGAIKDWIDGGCVDPEVRRKYEQAKQEEGFANTIKDAATGRLAQGFNRAGKGVGSIGGGIAPGTQGFFEGVARTAGAWGSSMAAMHAGTNLISRSGIDLSQVQNFTGRNTTMGGLAQMGVATALSPFGGDIASKASIKLGGKIDTAASKFSSGIDAMY